MTVTVYRSSDTGSPPQLSGTAGSLITLLDALLVGTAGVAYGSKASQGWTRAAFSTTTKGVYQMPSGSTQHFLRVDDTNAQNAQLRGYESISDVDGAVSSGLFPTITQIALGAGLYLYKSTAASGTTRSWVAIGNGKWFMLFVNAGADTNGYMQAFGFGNIKSLKSGDGYHTLLLASSASSNTTSTFAGMQNVQGQPGGGTAANTGNYIARSYTQAGSAVALFKAMDVICCAGGSINGQLPFPNGPDGGIYLSPVHLFEPNASQPQYRGTVPGYWFSGHRKTDMGANTGDTLTGTGSYSGRTFEFVQMGSTSGTFIETSDTWDT